MNHHRPEQYLYMVILVILLITELVHLLQLPFRLCSVQHGHHDRHRLFNIPDDMAWHSTSTHVLCGSHTVPRRWMFDVNTGELRGPYDPTNWVSVESVNLDIQ